MDLSQINWIAIAAASVAAFAFGAAYYTLLGKHWMDAAGLSEESVSKRSAGPFVISFAGLVVMGIVLSLQLAQHQAGALSAGSAVGAAAVLWVGLVVTTTATNNAFRGAKPKLTLIDSGHWLGVLAIQALVLGAF